ncbi:hypothetical protein SAMN04487910_1344 [Aquimarina amphilecti]|uniref:Lipoprotein n=1 Tax=Aquimarina amphilecti TaxID=1038014 RepID=A0A1H7KJ69_AQUAM|nr:hypothetical protein [Aquimarina amphilecti]SEK86943.1 hypothetical protein SAMN04487910_1344 [Aquimarina amphilecti]
MKNILKTCLVLISLLSYSCITTQGADGKKSEDGKESAQLINSKEMIQKGFTKGTLSTSKSKDCPYVLTVEKYADKLDPINIQDFFKTDDMPDKVWVKYSDLRMNSRCKEARPVSIQEISKRTD